MFDLAAKRLVARGVGRRHVLMVGNDEAVDIRPAIRAGFMTALAACDGRTRTAAVPGEADPDVVLGRLEEMIHLL